MVEFWELIKEPGGAVWAITTIVIVWVLCIVFDCFAEDDDSHLEDCDHD